MGHDHRPATAGDADAPGAAARRRLRGVQLVEGATAITAGNLAGSTALVGFGLDSLIEVSSGLVILWQFRHRMSESRERTAQRLIAVTFFALAAYLSVEAGHALLTGARPDNSTVGIALAIASLAVMPVLSRWQRRTGRELGSAAVEGDGTQTLLCTYLSAVLLAGLVLNAAFGWCWADPLAALVIAVVAAKEGWESWNGDDCCDPAGMTSPSGARWDHGPVRRRLLRRPRGHREGPLPRRASDRASGHRRCPGPSRTIRACSRAARLRRSRSSLIGSSSPAQPGRCASRCCPSRVQGRLTPDRGRAPRPGSGW